MRKHNLKLGGIGFWHWDDGQRVSMVAFHKWRFGWEFQQSGAFYFLGFCYLWFAYKKEE